MGGFLLESLSGPVTYVAINVLTEASMALVAWDFGRSARKIFDRDYRVSVRFICRACGRTLGDAYGTERDPVWMLPPSGSSGRRDMPYRILANKPMRFRCHKKCGADVWLRHDGLQDAYRDAVIQQQQGRQVRLPLTDRLG